MRSRLINQVRIEEAKQLMTEHDDMTIQEVALAIDFPSGSCCSSSDKREVTPLKWRRQTPLPSQLPHIVKLIMR